MKSVVAIDIETTGLDPERDAIIEVGAVRFSGTRVESEWSSLINPRRHVPEFITSLTGIDDAMLRQAPTFREVAPIIQEFVGDARILGHNIRFDLGFLQKGVALVDNEVADTYQLASVLLPRAARYNLGALGKELGVMLPATHRALDDARVTHAIYLRLLELARELPVSLVQEIARLGEQIQWDAAPVLDDLLRARTQALTKERPVTSAPRERIRSGYPALENPDIAASIDIDEVAAALEYGGAFSRHFPAYEHRPEQVEMARAVAHALSRGNHLMIEAGTGVGKSFAYLVPAALFAMRNNTRVLISTNTINLQDQLITKDLPDLKAALGIDVRAAVLKGRVNYLCPRRLANMRRFGVRNETDLRVLAKILVWRLTDLSGDRGTINLNGNAEREVWWRLSAEDEGCTTETCLSRMGGECPFHRAKDAAQSAHLLVVNHALLLSDVAAQGRVLPDYSYLIVDEGHHLEAATTGAISYRITRPDLERLLKDLGGSNSGVLGRTLAAARQALPPSDFGLIQQRIAAATDSAFRLEQLSREFFEVLTAFVAVQQEGDQPSTYAWQARIVPATRTQSDWEAIEAAWEPCSQVLDNLAKLISEVHQAASQAYAAGAEEFEDAISELGTTYRRMAEAESQISGLISEPSANQVYWIEMRPSGNGLSLNAAPLRVGPLIEQVLWHEKASIILTSATLTTHGEFQYLRGTLGADEADELQLGSPFDYESSTLLYVASDIPEPNMAEYQQALHRTLIATARAAGGRTLALFTSYAALKKASQAISSPLGKDDIVVLEHGEGSSPNVLLESFRATERAVLLGTRSFWEGVDVPGEALSVLFIPKLPFDVPTDPLIAARAEMYEDPFTEYYVPEAILKFRQGFGRLIRTASDRGVVAILDRRIISKQYGRLFLESLPRCTVRQGPAAKLATEVARWLRT
ncbi:MAG TPA: helicase C-terminal domain-containing protein [Anaerolineales bacterium]